MPTGDAPLVAAAPFKLGGWGGLNLVQDLIDAYQMVDGQDINESSQDYPYPDASVNLKELAALTKLSLALHFWRALLECITIANLVFICNDRLLPFILARHFFFGESVQDMRLLIIPTICFR